MQIQAPQSPPATPVGSGAVIDAAGSQAPVPPGALSPPQGAAADAASTDAFAGFVDAMRNLGWVDITALSVIGVFCVIGLFKGFLWQTSRVAILAAAYAAAASLGQALADTLVTWTHSGPVAPTADQRETAYYIACVLIFLGVLIALSLLALLLQNLVQKAGLGFYDRLGGGAVGIATGGFVVLLLLSLVLMFFPKSHLAEAADASHSLRWSQKAIASFGGVLPAELKRLFEPRVDAPRQGAAAPGAVPSTGLPTVLPTGQPVPGARPDRSPNPPPKQPGKQAAKQPVNQATNQPKQPDRAKPPNEATQPNQAGQASQSPYKQPDKQPNKQANEKLDRPSPPRAPDRDH